MKNKMILWLSAGHFLISLVAFLGLYWMAVAAQDGGSDPSLGWLEAPVHFLLLQPIAHWAIQWLSLAWWTWGGLLLLTALVGLNSLVAVSLILAAWRRLRKAV